MACYRREISRQRSVYLHIWLIAGAFLVSLVGTKGVRHYALATNLLDLPNARSSHQIATPRGGGLAIVAALVVAIFMTRTFTSDSIGPVEVWFPAALMVAVVGFLDDRFGLNARIRLLAHGVAAVALISCIPVSSLTWPTGIVPLGATGVVLVWFATVWSVNLFNFMDGIDGLAGSQAVFVFGAAGAIALLSRGDLATPNLAFCSSAASLGFLAWNWPPARIFMGDAGSGFIGFLIATLALVMSVSGDTSIWIWLTLYGCFVADATVTLVVRAARGERFYDAHRQHAYQHLARRWRSHRKVVELFAAVNMLWLLPLAMAVALRPRLAVWLEIVAFAPLFMGAFLLGAGTAEKTDP